MALRFLTAGESHGPALTVIVEGLPADVPIESEKLNRELRRRMAGYGRGGRMKIEKDAAEILGGVRFGRTIGAPVSLLVRNLDFANWQDAMSPTAAHPGERAARVVTRERSLVLCHPICSPALSRKLLSMR